MMALMLQQFRKLALVPGFALQHLSARALLANRDLPMPFHLHED